MIHRRIYKTASPGSFLNRSPEIDFVPMQCDQISKVRLFDCAADLSMQVALRVSVTLLSVLLVASLSWGGQPSPSDPNLKDWTLLDSRPTEADLYCAMWSMKAWIVSATKTGLEVIQGPAHDKSHGSRVAVSDGWLIGDDFGEWGGGLSWMSRDGNGWYELHPAADSPVSASDPYKAENVLGFLVIHDQIIVFMGLDHLGSRSGRIFRAVRQGTAWSLVPVAVLDGSPLAWLVEDDQILVVTRSGLWAVDAADRATKLFGLEVGFIWPTSLARTTDGSVYIGLVHYVLRLRRTDGGWTETWFAPSNCTHIQLEKDTCKCITKPTDGGAAEQAP